MKQAARATLSAIATTGVLLLLGRVWPPLSEMPSILMGTLSALLIVLRASGKTRREQKQATVASGVSGIAMVLLACAVHDDPLRNALVLSLLAFTAFYIRRFGLRYVGLGMHCLFIYLFTTVTTQSGAACAPLVSAVAVSIPVAYIVNFYFLPEDRSLLFRDSVFLFLDRAGRTGALLGGTFSGRIPAAEADRRMHDALNELQAHLTTCESILGGIETDDAEERGLFERIYLHAYRVYGALSLAMDGVLDAVRIEGPIARSLQQEMEEAVQLLEAVLRNPKHSVLRTRDGPKLLDRYRRVVGAFYEDLLRGEGIQEKPIYFLVRVLLAMQRAGGSLENLYGDLILFEEQMRR